MPIVRPILAKIEEKELLRYAGLKNGEDIGQPLLQAACRETLLYARPVGSWQIYDYRQLALLAVRHFTPGGNDVAHHMAGATKAAVLAVTVGEALEERIKELFASGEYALALLLDAAATTALEQVADSICLFIASAVGREGLEIGRRFSPGYGDWALAEQPEVLRLADGEKIGVKLSSAFMLLPRKSVTAVLPLFPKQAKRLLEENCCETCEQTDCQFRRNQ